MSTFLTGLATTAVLTALAIFVYDFSQITTSDDASLAGVHISARNL